jgi:hypothetical protein
MIDDIHCHHKKMKHLGGSDEYSNLIIVSERMHRLIHATDIDLIGEIMSKYKLNRNQMDKLNELRKTVENEVIDVKSLIPDTENHNFE